MIVLIYDALVRLGKLRDMPQLKDSLKTYR